MKLLATPLAFVAFALFIAYLALVDLKRWALNQPPCVGGDND